jgi:hypothetical protein
MNKEMQGATIDFEYVPFSKLANYEKVCVSKLVLLARLSFLELSLMEKVAQISKKKKKLMDSLEVVLQREKKTSEPEFTVEMEMEDVLECFIESYKDEELRTMYPESAFSVPKSDDSKSGDSTA